VEQSSKNPKPKLKIDWATHAAAKYACENWHYSKCVPVGKIVKLGVWENDKFIGVVLFSRGASPNLLKPYKLTQYEGCELTRIALNNHDTPVSRILSVSMSFLKKSNPGLKLIISFADPRQNHHGGIYQATNWIYSGTQVPGGSLEYLINGKWTHPKSVGSTYGVQGKKFIEKNPGIKTRKPTLKHRYLMPLTKEIRKQIEPLRKPYPKRASSVESGTSVYQTEGGGESPTDALQNTSSNTLTNEKITQSG